MTTIWLDIESGTYFSAPPFPVRTKDWSAKDWECWIEDMSDTDRGAWGEYHLQHGQTKQVKPSDWCNPQYEVPGLELA